MSGRDGGPAFAAACESGAQSGMSLRDYFAGQALAGFCANPEFDITAEIAAKWAWEQADAMLAAREAP